MDFQKTYNQLIVKARTEVRVKGQNVYYEAHHIVPECIGGEGTVWAWKNHPNIILLTPHDFLETYDMSDINMTLVQNNVDFLRSQCNSLTKRTTIY